MFLVTLSCLGHSDEFRLFFQQFIQDSAIASSQNKDFFVSVILSVQILIGSHAAQNRSINQVALCMWDFRVAVKDQGKEDVKIKITMGN